MTAIRWRDSLPPPQPIRHRVRARQDFEDSVLADQLSGPEHPGRAMLAAAKAPRQRIVLPYAQTSDRAVAATPEKRRQTEALMDDWGDLTIGSSPSFVHYAGLAVAGAVVVACTWLASIHLPELLELFGS